MIRVKFYGIYNIVFFLSSLCWSQNVAPTLLATGNQAYCPKSQIKIVTDFTITDPDDTAIAALFIQISSGYNSEEDILTLLGVHPNIVTSWNKLEGKLELRGVSSALVNYTDLIGAVKDIIFESTSNKPTNKSFSITIGDANYLPSTDHYYEYVPSLGITWRQAKAEAELRTYFGLKGYLATIGSIDEAQLSGEQAAGAGWIGGSDEETEGVWKWVTGPEKGIVFWNGTANGESPNFAYWNTNNAEPNQRGDEDYAHITAPGVGIPGSWNDLTNTGDSSGDYQPKGYIVEYGGSVGDPILNISASTSIFTASILNVSNSISVCESDSFTLEATASMGNVLWFDTDIGGTPVETGTSFITPLLNSTVTYYAVASLNGCESGQRLPVTITVNSLPVIEPSILFKNCDEDGLNDGLTVFNLNEANIITNNTSLDLNITYYLDFDEAINKTSNFIKTPNNFNNATASIVYARVENLNECYRVSTVNLEASTTSFPPSFIKELTRCDNDFDGFYEFDLTEATQYFIDEFPLGQNLSVHYYKNLNDAQLEKNEILDNARYINEIPFFETLYVRVESDDNGNCFGIGPHLKLIVNTKPEFEIEQLDAYCLDNKAIRLDVVNPKDVYTYEWRNELGEIVSELSYVYVNTIESYTVSAISDAECESMHSFKVRESEKANIDINDITIVELSENNKIIINNRENNLGVGDYEFSLNDKDGFYQDDPFFDRVAAGNHKLYIRDKNKCGITELDVFILGFPKFFTPNNDGDNDTWQIIGLGVDYSNTSFINIYNRHGKLIKQLNAKTNGWDGSFNGQNLENSDYWFHAILVDFSGKVRTYKGHFSLIR